ncbi:beta-lactamase family protein [Bacillus sp. 3103sda1]|uniref:serine hydrolase domain-containing protein n=1 Tax=Bacillus sp. 3103sda1 TaxID=2953808 RepID=UPI00209CA254|nr:serine hydrolase domain-containing protein [Bacillus sp. 3103sda1]MCP1122392.1 beta-lactamase family protein [Bacillus sp. 3103sda1]
MKNTFFRFTLAILVLTSGFQMLPNVYAEVPSDCLTTTESQVDHDLPPLDVKTLTETISQLPDEENIAAQILVSGKAGGWQCEKGIANLDSQTPVKKNDRFRIGSITKVFTTTMVLQLVAEHKINLNQSVQHYLPNLLPLNYPKITVGQLLNHTSGLPSSNLPDDFQWQYEHRLDQWTPTQIIKLATKNPIEFQPGTKQNYKNINTIIAAMIMEKVTGETYAQQLEIRILKPLGLYNTYVPGNDPNISGSHTHGYQEVINTDGTKSLIDVTTWNQSLTWAAGDMISTTEDLNRFLTALFQRKLLPQKQLDLMFAVPNVKDLNGNPAVYSMGLAKAKINGRVLWGKSGARPGYLNGFVVTEDFKRLTIYSLNNIHAKDDLQSKLFSKFIPLLY